MYKAPTLPWEDPPVEAAVSLSCSAGSDILWDAPQEACHEANASPWVRLAGETGAKLVWWRVREGPTAESALADLAELLTPRCPLCSHSGWGAGLASTHCRFRAPSVACMQLECTRQSEGYTEEAHARVPTLASRHVTRPCLCSSPMGTRPLPRCWRQIRSVPLRSRRRS